MRTPLVLATLLFAPAVAFAQTPPPAGPQTTVMTVPRGAGMPQGAVQGGNFLSLPRTLDELEPWADRVFARLDANGDGSITGEEMGLLTREPIAALGGGRLRALISQSDANRDARVSREEFGAGALRAFQRLGANGDGRLSEEEMPNPTMQRPMSITMPPRADPMPMPMPDGSGD